MAEKIVSQDSVGMVFGRLTVVREFMGPNGTKARARHWECQCICGRITTVITNNLKQRGTGSCGCTTIEANTTHGMTNTPEYEIWIQMKGRIQNPNHTSYKNYGARGISLDPRWLDFGAFIKDVGMRPSPKHSIERINNEGNYEPDNVRWATRAEQNRNKRSNRNITYNGKTQCMADWAKEMGISPRALSRRLREWPLDIAIGTPRLLPSRQIRRLTTK